ncbi:hypothetical protein ACFFSY_03055, partial [Paenibacillus aurantiacus]
VDRQLTVRVQCCNIVVDNHDLFPPWKLKARFLADLVDWQPGYRLSRALAYYIYIGGLRD